MNDFEHVSDPAHSPAHADDRDPVDRSTRAEELGQWLHQQDPLGPVDVWEVEDFSVIAWVLDGQLFAIGTPAPFGMAGACRTTAQAFVHAVHDFHTGVTPALLVDPAEPLAHPPLDTGAIAGLAQFTGSQLRDMLTTWALEAAETDRALVFAPTDEHPDAPVVVLEATEARRVAQHYCFGDEEIVTLAIDEDTRPLLLGGLVVVRFSATSAEGAAES